MKQLPLAYLEAKQVKSKTIAVKRHLRALSQSAARKAMPGLEKKILATGADQKNGVQYKAVIKIKGSYSNTKLKMYMNLS
jgi:hypothetical protein